MGLGLGLRVIPNPNPNTLMDHGGQQRGQALRPAKNKQRNTLKIMGQVFGRMEVGGGGNGGHTVVVHGGQQRGQGPCPCMIEGAGRDNRQTDMIC